MENKYLYCTQCEMYPDEILEEASHLKTRKWDGECYETISQNRVEEDTEVYSCPLCGEILIIK